MARAAYFPNILLSASGGFGNSSFSSWFTWPSRFWSVGPSLAETIFDAGLRRATVQQFQANYDQTVANYRQTVLTAFQQVEDNLASLRILSQAIDQQNAAVIRLAIGPAIATQNSVFASVASSWICETPPSANRVIALTFNPRDWATREWASSCNSRVTKNRAAVTSAAIQIWPVLQVGFT